MSDESQLFIPESFLALFQVPGKTKPTASRAEVAQRYEWCEDMAQTLTEPARMQMLRLGLTEADVAHSMRQGLAGDDTGLSDAEATWVCTRLNELLRGH
jgi:hypothetical protein